MNARNMFALLTLLLLPFGARAEASQHAHSQGRTAPWSPEIVELFATLPVQDGGRVKPMDKVAGLNLLTFNGKRKFELPSGEVLGPSEWLLDCLFFPDQARTYEHFRIQNDAVLTAIGMQALEGKKKSDRYSFDQLAPSRDRLEQEASRVSQIANAERSPTQKQTLKLAHDLFKFETLAGFLEPARWKYKTDGAALLEELYDGRELSTLSEVLGQSGRLYQLAQELNGTGNPNLGALQQLFSQLDSVLAVGSQSFAFVPPPEGAERPEEWWKLSDIVMATFDRDGEAPEHTELVASLERLEASKNDPAAFEEELRGLHGEIVRMADARGEYDTIQMEVALYRYDLFTNSLVFFLLGFLLLGMTWLVPKNVWLTRGVWTSVSIGLLLLIVGIVMRCIIRSRPPVVSLYDTVLFITGVSVLVALVAERITRVRIGLAVATILGVGGMFLAGRYELTEIRSSGDTMASVVAVLDTNYYLAIHVTTVTMGYAGGLLAAAIAHFWIFGQLLGIRRGDTAFYKTITRMIYGTICFSLLFAIFGTIMGGVWANDSWGRFWGWDPKENGALLICIWSLLILHARMGGYIRDRGIAVMAVLLGVVVSASWWGVNQLSVGLHSYGFTDGVMRTLLIYWGIAGLVCFTTLLEGWMKSRPGGPAGGATA